MSKANQRIRLIGQKFQQLGNQTLVSLIRLFLQYGTHVINWQNSQELEKVQRRATYLVKHLRDIMAFSSGFRYVKIPSIVYRTKRSHMLQMYRTITGIDNLDKNNFVKKNGSRY